MSDVTGLDAELPCFALPLGRMHVRSLKLVNPDLLNPEMTNQSVIGRLMRCVYDLRAGASGPVVTPSRSMQHNALSPAL